MKQGLLDKLQEIIGNGHSDEKELLYRLKGLVYNAENQSQVMRQSKRISNLVSESITQLKEGGNQSNLIKTGFRDFDQELGGLGLGELIVIGGRPSMGKTQLLVNLSLTISLETPVLYFTFDLSEFLLTNRFISTLTGIPVADIFKNELTHEQRAQLDSIENEFMNRKLFVNDSCNSSLSALRTHCKEQVENQGIQVIVVDYLQMMSSSKYRNSRELEISHITRELKNIAKDFNVCVIATSQLSRSVEYRGGLKHPQLSDLRESGAIEQDADKVIFIYRPEYYGIESDADDNSTAGLAEIILAKNRNGKLATIKLKRDQSFTTYQNFDQHKNDFDFLDSRLDELNAPF
jgi:replicative DNA helicase